MILTVEAPGELSEAKERLDECLNEMLEYCLIHGLTLNRDKTHGMIIAKKESEIEYKR